MLRSVRHDGILLCRSDACIEHTGSLTDSTQLGHSLLCSYGCVQEMAARTRDSKKLKLNVNSIHTSPLLFVLYT